MAYKNIILDEWQDDFINYKGHSVLCTGRRVGKTYIHARKACKRMLETPNTKIIVASLTEDQAKLIIMMALEYLEGNHKTSIAKGHKKPTQNKVELKNGSFMLARPVGNTGDAIRGFEGDVLILDEVSRFNELILTAATPVLLTTGGEIWMCSTPYGKQGYFYEAFRNKNNRFRVWHISSEDVIRNRVISESWTEHQRSEAIKFLEEEKTDKSERVYGQEYLGLFVEELRQYFADELLNRACILKRPESVPVDANYLGVDIARMGKDKCAYEILHRRTNGSTHQVENITKKKQFTTQTEDDILALNSSWNLERIGIDAGSGSLGVGIYDHLLQRTETKRKVVPMNNRTISLDRDGKKLQRIFKEDMYENLLAMLERNEILLLDDPEVFTSLKSVQEEPVGDEEKGNITKTRIFGTDTHIAEGLVRAAWLCKKEKLNKLWISYI